MGLLDLSDDGTVAVSKRVAVMKSMSISVHIPVYKYGTLFHKIWCTVCTILKFYLCVY
jgi:hypothetical protein